MAMESRDKTAFVSHEKLTSSSVCSLHGKMRQVHLSVHWMSSFSLVIRKIALVYVADIVILLKRRKAHIEHVLHILALLRHTGLKIELKECKFFSRMINNLGHLIPQEQFWVLHHKTYAISDLKSFTYIAELRSFLRL